MWPPDPRACSRDTDHGQGDERGLRVVLSNYGSTGSVYPYVALAVALRRHGHRPLLALPPSFADLAARHALPFAPIGPDQRRLQTAINEAMVTMPETAAGIESLLAPLADALPAMYGDLRAACTSADLLISGPVQPAGLAVHETIGVPYVSVQNVHYASGGVAPFREALSSVVNGFRTRLGLRPLHDPLLQPNDAAALVLVAMSRHVRARPVSWPSHVHLTGYFFLDETWTPDASLAAFLASASPPIVVTFGSMTHADADRLTAIVAQATARAGCRAVLQRGWSGLGSRELPPHVHRLEFAPHDWLFPRASLVVHHGGSGTTASVFRAGRPSVFVPHAWDQPIWAQLARDLGCAAPMIPLTELTADRLTTAITDVLATPGYHHAALALGRRIRAERGVETACHLIEQLASQLGLT